MTKPWLWDRRHARGPLGVVARWWGARRVRRIKAALAERDSTRGRDGERRGSAPDETPPLTVRVRGGLSWGE